MRLDRSLIPIESSCFQGNGEIVWITMSMIQKDASWQTDQSAQAIRNLENLQNYLFNLWIERLSYYGTPMEH